MKILKNIFRTIPNRLGDLFKENESGAAILYAMGAGLAVSVVLAMVPSHFQMAQKKLNERHTIDVLKNKSREIQLTLRSRAACSRVLGSSLSWVDGVAVYNTDGCLVDLVAKHGSLAHSNSGKGNANGNANANANANKTSNASAGSYVISMTPSVASQNLQFPADQITLGKALFAGKKTYLATFKVPIGTNEFPSPHIVYSELPVYLVFDGSNNLVKCQGTQISADKLTIEDQICKAGSPTSIYDPDTQRCITPI